MLSREVEWKDSSVWELKRITMGRKHLKSDKSKKEGFGNVILNYSKSNFQDFI